MMDFLVENALEREQERLGIDELPNKPGEAKIIVVGAGGAGNNSMSRLMQMGGVAGATTVAVNTDMQQLKTTHANKKILIGYKLTEGLGAGGYPDIGEKAALESKNELMGVLKGAHLVFLTCGLGGGTGTGALPVIAEMAKKEGAIVIASVTTPFDLEKARMFKAEEGLVQLRECCNTVIVIDNNKLVEYVPDLPLNQAFGVADELIATMIKGISETITVPSLVNLDFADIKTIMTGGGVAMIGVGESDSKNKVQEAVQSALSHPLLDVEYKGATGAIIHITGGPDTTLAQVTDAGGIISDALDPSAQVIWGARVDQKMQGKLRVMAIITGVKSPNILGKCQTEPFQSPIRAPKHTPPMLKELSIDYLHTR